jgi:hypothetical protein
MQDHEHLARVQLIERDPFAVDEVLREALDPKQRDRRLP